MGSRAAFLALCLLAAAVSPALSTPLTTAAACAALSPGAVDRVTAIVDGDTLVLAGGEEVRLVGIQAPKLPLGRPDFEPWPLADAAYAALAALALDREVALAYGGARRDRHGRVLAHLQRAEDGTWIQGALLRQGMARVYSFADNRACVAEMLAEERAARAERRGIWAHPFYRILSAAEAAAHIGSFQLVEGRVLHAEVVKGRGYLNFGEDWKRDFTVTAGPRQRRSFAQAGVDWDDYAGHLVRVRGWLKSYNGPMIEVTHPEQIEVLAP